MPRKKTMSAVHKIITAIIAGTALILFWRGVWLTADTIPFLQDPVISMFVGLLVLSSLHLLVKELIYE